MFSPPNIYMEKKIIHLNWMNTYNNNTSSHAVTWSKQQDNITPRSPRSKIIRLSYGSCRFFFFFNIFRLISWTIHIKPSHTVLSRLLGCTQGKHISTRSSGSSAAGLRRVHHCRGWLASFQRSFNTEPQPLIKGGLATAEPPRGSRHSLA